MASTDKVAGRTKAYAQATGRPAAGRTARTSGATTAPPAPPSTPAARTTGLSVTGGAKSTGRRERPEREDSGLGNLGEIVSRVFNMPQLPAALRMLAPMGGIAAPLFNAAAGALDIRNRMGAGGATSGNLRNTSYLPGVTGGAVGSLMSGVRGGAQSMGMTPTRALYGQYLAGGTGGGPGRGTPETNPYYWVTYPQLPPEEAAAGGGGGGYGGYGRGRGGGGGGGGYTPAQREQFYSDLLARWNYQ